MMYLKIICYFTLFIKFFEIKVIIIFPTLHIKEVRLRFDNQLV